MEEKYLYNGKVYNKTELEGLAAKSGVSFNEYISGIGATPYKEEKNASPDANETYSYNGKNYSAAQLNDLATKSGVSFDEYVKGIGASKKKDTGSNFFSPSAFAQRLKGNDPVKGKPFGVAAPETIEVDNFDDLEKSRNSNKQVKLTPRFGSELTLNRINGGENVNGKDLENLLAGNKKAYYDIAKQLMPDTDPEFLTTGESLDQMALRLNRRKDVDAVTNAIANGTILQPANKRKLNNVVQYPEAKSLVDDFISTYADNDETGSLSRTELINSAIKNAGVKNSGNVASNISNGIAQLDNQIASLLSGASFDMKTSDPDNPFVSTKISATPESYANILKDLQSNDISVSGPNGSISKKQIAELILERQGLMASTKDRSPDIDAIKGKAKEALTYFGKYDIASEKVGFDPDKSVEHLLAGLEYIKSTNIGLYSNAMNSLKDKGRIGGKDMEDILKAGQQIFNTYAQSRVSENPELADKIMDNDYEELSVDKKKSVYANALGEKLRELGYTNDSHFSEKEIRNAAKYLPELTDKAVIDALIVEEAISGYDAIPKTGLASEFVNGIFQPIYGMAETLSSIGESQSETYLRASQMSNKFNRMVIREDGEVSDRLASTDRWYYKAVNGLGQFVTQVAATKGIGGVAAKGAGVLSTTLRPLAVATEFAGNSRMATVLAGTSNTLGRYSAIENIAGTIGSTYMQSYGRSYDDMLLKTGDTGKASIGASINAGADAATEMFLSPLAIANKAFSGLRSKMAADLLDLAGKGDVTQLAAKSRPILQRFFTEAAKIEASEIGEEVTAETINYFTEMALSPQTAQDRNLSEDIWETVKETSIQTLLPALLGGGGAAMPADFTKTSLNTAALRLSESQRYLQNALDKKQITKPEYEGILLTLKTHNQNLNSAPKEDAVGNEIDVSKRAEYALLETSISNLNRKAESKISEPEKENIQAKITEYRNKQKEILNGTPAVDNNTATVPVINSDTGATEVAEISAPVAPELAPLKTVLSEDEKVTTVENLTDEENKEMIKASREGRLDEFLLNVANKPVVESNNQLQADYETKLQEFNQKNTTTNEQTQKQEEAGTEQQATENVAPNEQGQEGQESTASQAAAGIISVTPAMQQPEPVTVGADNKKATPSALFNSLRETGKVNEFLNEDNFEGSISEVQSQALTAPKSMEGRVGNELTDELISRNSDKDIEASIKNFQSIISDENSTEEQISDADANIKLLEAAMETKAAKVADERSRQLLEKKRSPLKIVQDANEQELAESKLTEEDNIEQEPNVADIESKANSDNETELAEAIAQADALIQESTDVVNVPMSEISTNENEYQGRKNSFSERSANNVATQFDQNKFDPIVLFKHPDGKTYVLSGHSRYEGMRRRNADSIPARYFEGTAEQAKEFALKSNKLGDLQTDIENASYYRGRKDAGASRNEIMTEAKRDEQEGTASRIVDYAYLNPKGKAYAALEQLLKGEGDTTDNIKRIAQKIGRIRSQNDHLTDAHENELFDYFLQDNKNIPTDREISDPNSVLSRSINSVRFDNSEPLNLNRFQYKSPQRMQWEAERGALVKALNELRAEVTADKATGWTGLKKRAVMSLAKGNTKADIDLAESKFNKDEQGIATTYAKLLIEKQGMLQAAQDQLQKHLLREKNIIEGDKAQANLFFQIRNTPSGKAQSSALGKILDFFKNKLGIETNLLTEENFDKKYGEGAFYFMLTHPVDFEMWLQSDSLLKKLIDIKAPKALIDKVDIYSKIKPYDETTPTSPNNYWETSEGYYNWNNDIYVNQLFSDVQTEDRKKHVIIHEATHLVTAANVWNYYNGGKVDPKVREALDYLDEIFEEVQNNHIGPYPYGFTNMREFIAEFISNESFRNVVGRNLSEQNTEEETVKQKGLIQKTFDAIKNFVSTSTGIPIESNVNVEALNKINSQMEGMFRGSNDTFAAIRERGLKDGIKYLKTQNGEIYGFAFYGEIWVDPAVASNDTPIHEYAHIWGQFANKQPKDSEAKKLYEKGIELATGVFESLPMFLPRGKKKMPPLTPLQQAAKNILMNPAYNLDLEQFSRKGLESKRNMADELLAQIIGDNGAKLFVKENLATKSRFMLFLKNMWNEISNAVKNAIGNNVQISPETQLGQIADYVGTKLLTSPTLYSRMKAELDGSEGVRFSVSKDKIEDTVRKMMKQGATDQDITDILKQLGNNANQIKATINRVRANDGLFAGMTQAEQDKLNEDFENSFDAETKKMVSNSIKDKIDRFRVRQTGVKTEYRANSTLEDLTGTKQRGKAAEGDTTNLELIAEDVMYLVDEVVQENGSIKPLMDYLRFNKNKTRVADKMDVAGINDSNHYAVINILSSLLSSRPELTPNITIAERKAYIKYLQKLTKPVGRSVGQLLNTGKLRTVARKLTEGDELIEQNMFGNVANAINEAMEKVDKLINGEFDVDDKGNEIDIYSDEDLLQDSMNDTEAELERQVEQSRKLSIARKLANKLKTLARSSSKTVSTKDAKALATKMQDIKEKVKEIFKDLKC